MVSSTVYVFCSQTMQLMGAQEIVLAIKGMGVGNLLLHRSRPYSISYDIVNVNSFVCLLTQSQNDKATGLTSWT